jgi:hypothetical protein
MAVGFENPRVHVVPVTLVLRCECIIVPVGPLNLEIRLAGFSNTRRLALIGDKRLW